MQIFPSARMTLTVVGLVLGFVASVLLFYGSQGLPLDTLTYSLGRSEQEQRFLRTRRLCGLWGFGLLAVSFLAQLAATVAG